MVRYQIVGSLRMAAFIAQIGHESGQFRYVRELGNDQYLSKYDTGSLAKRLGNTPEADGDGQKYRGRGLIQITGRANYMTCGEALALELELELLISRSCWRSRSTPVCLQPGTGHPRGSTRWLIQASSTRSPSVSTAARPARPIGRRCMPGRSRCWREVRRGEVERGCCWSSSP